MPLVKFNIGTRSQLDATSIHNGAVYFIPDSNNGFNGLGEIAYDWNNCRSWVMAPTIITSNNLDSSVPRRGELIVVIDAFQTQDSESGDTTTYPGLKIGNGSTSVQNLPYITEFFQQNADILEQRLNDHINDTTIHYEMKVAENTHVLTVFNEKNT